MIALGNYALDQWITADAQGDILYDAVTGEARYTASSKGLDFAAMMHHARTVGNPALRKLTFHERGRMLKALALYLTDCKEKYYTVSFQTGATRADSWIDIDGGIGTLFAYASLRRKFPNEPFYVEGDMANLSKNGTFVGQHILTPKRGVAIHINAFNFPIWGMLEKIAVNLLAGMPAIVKPATLTSYLTEVVVRDIIASGILPKGSLQLICGSARGILDSITSQDVVTFTGSAHTGRQLKAHPRIIEEAVPFNMEADSLNCIVLGQDVTPDMPEFDIFIKEIRKEMTAKCGQKCTAIRRVFVPRDRIDAVQAALAQRLAETTIGSPLVEGVRMGALAGKTQLEEVREKIQQLLKTSSLVYGDLETVQVMGADAQRGAFMSPLVLRNDQPFTQQDTHNIEAFGPATTLMPYDEAEEAIALANLGKGSLCSTIVTHDARLAQHYVLEAGSYHGRILILNREAAKESTGHGSPMPQLVHGGPGRAGGGEEMGGLRGVKHYLQRTAIQGHPTFLTEVTRQYQVGAAYKTPDQHVFRKYFEDLEVGHTVITHKRTITEADIVNFANVSWDHFYAHTDATSLEGTLFEKRVAHGYFILSAAAGLFVDPGKGPVLLNYGLEECRFLKPMYAGATIGVRLTVKEKVAQEQRSEEDVPKGIVKFLVDVYDETGETVAIATILTMVQCRLTGA